MSRGGFQRLCARGPLRLGFATAAVLAVGDFEALWIYQRFAEYKSAIWQIPNLRYDACWRMLDCSLGIAHWALLIGHR
jgi:hypothetical protein